MAKETAVFGGGCFWGVEYIFKRVPRVLEVESGYMGGEFEASYGEVSSGDTGHAEVVKIVFDSSQISYEKLLEVFFKCHDSTTMNRQGPDVGEQYRSVIFYFDEKQKEKAEKSRREYEKALGKKVVTEIVGATRFYSAEEYHQKYYDKKGGKPYCHIMPKVDFGKLGFNAK